MDDDDELDEPLGEHEAKRIARHILRVGKLVFSSHAKARMQEREFEATDVVNVLRGGVVDDIHRENGSWRYRFNTRTMQVVIAFIDPTACVVVTVMRA